MSNTENKLELKHIVGYLPYDVQVFVNDSKFYQTKIIHKLHIEDGIGSVNHILTSDRYKLVLRPLSDLTKEIEVNGEKFVPIEKLFNLKSIEKKEAEDFIFNVKFGFILHQKHSLVQRLYEWHFDIHGLIKKGLAIDKNTLP